MTDMREKARSLATDMMMVANMSPDKFNAAIAKFETALSEAHDKGMEEAAKIADAMETVQQDSTCTWIAQAIRNKIKD